MIVDSSAIIGILAREAEAHQLAEALAMDPTPQMSAATYLEAGIVIDGNRDPALSRMLDELIVRLGVSVEPVTFEQARIAREAYRDFGKGSGHPAGLNYGDVFAYALAKTTGQPLLFKGNDFSKTDVTSAI